MIVVPCPGARAWMAMTLSGNPTSTAKPGGSGPASEASLDDRAGLPGELGPERV